MKLHFNDKFTLEIINGESETIIVGFLKRLTKKQEQEIKTKFKKEYATIEKIGELAKKAQREKLRRELNNTSDVEDVEDVKKKSSELLDKLYELQDGIDESKFKEDIAKLRFELSVESTQMEELLSLTNDFGYSFVLEMISKDITEKKGNDKNAL